MRLPFRAKPALPARALSSNQDGRIAIGRDGSLFVIIGDRSKSPPRGHGADTDLGRVVHITPDGDPAPGNPFMASTIRAKPSARASLKKQVMGQGTRDRPFGVSFLHRQSVSHGRATC
jgi:glucose/arabinose dehydrogenase